MPEQNKHDLMQTEKNRTIMGWANLLQKEYDEAGIPITAKQLARLSYEFLERNNSHLFHDSKYGYKPWKVREQWRVCI